MNEITIIPETGVKIGRTVFFSVRDSDGWVDFGIVFGPKETRNRFSFCEIIADPRNVSFPESRRIQDLIRRRIES